MCRQGEVTIRKCCPEFEILDTRLECVENMSDENINLHEEVVKKVLDLSEKDLVAREVNIVSNVTGVQCDIDNAYIALVKAVLSDDSLVLDLPNQHVVITDKYSCVEQTQDQEGFVAVVCHHDIPTKRGFVNKCCPFGKAVAMNTKECQDTQEVGEEEMFLSNLKIRSRWTNLSTKVVEVKISVFENLCETGDAVPAVVSEITDDGFMFNATTKEEIEYGCVDTDQGDIVAWICSG